MMTPVDLPDVSAYPTLFRALADGGWSSSELDQISRANVLRVMHDNETSTP